MAKNNYFLSCPYCGRMANIRTSSNSNIKPPCNCPACPVLSTSTKINETLTEKNVSMESAKKVTKEKTFGERVKKE